MADVPVIPATSPTIIPATDEKSYDSWRSTWILVDATDPTQPIVAIAKLRKGLVKEDQSWEYSPNNEEAVIRIDDLWAEAQLDPNLAAVMQGLLTYIAGRAMAEGKI